MCFSYSGAFGLKIILVYSVLSPSNFLSLHAELLLVPRLSALVTSLVLSNVSSNSITHFFLSVCSAVYSLPQLQRLLSHYLFWIILLPFAVAHKSRDDCLLLETDNRLSLKKQQKVRSTSPQTCLYHRFQFSFVGRGVQLCGRFDACVLLNRISSCPPVRTA